jgi:hypothetical protein
MVRNSIKINISYVYISLFFIGDDPELQKMIKEESERLTELQKSLEDKVKVLSNVKRTGGLLLFFRL